MNARRTPKNTSLNTKQSAQKKTTKASLRIIAGQWRSRQLPIPNLEGLRPTPDRVRETLFNWLTPYIAGANCADIFCGSGALGLEALSRGAKQCTFIDNSSVVTKQMQSNLATLGCQNAFVQQANAVDFLAAPNPKERFDIVFIDPPFRQGWVNKLLPLLTENWLNTNALIYLEMEKEVAMPDISQSWQLLKEKQAGQLIYRLYQC
ncbi:16S rRNA (guanine(966)-N(2))-methyltransferase RsmD [Marinomonas agarivorans]|nr:16S rRNA (guanine(966)-N(2))-methyltransferase RsmD [Marinomonas agarivorans]